MSGGPKIVALCGGVGGSKLALGLANIEPHAQLSIVVNTGDDFEHLGLTICPDIDTVSYTLAGIANPDTGWGRAQETWSFMETLEALGGDTWFRLGDKDLALNSLRTHLLANGSSLSEVTSQITTRLGIAAEIIPMSDDAVRTLLRTENGVLEFQDYFVRQQCKPVVSSIEFLGVESALPAPRFAELLDDPTVDAFVICPSNPFISVDPILAIPSVRRRLANHAAPVVGVSPVVGGQSIKGPTSKMMHELNLGSSALDIASYYEDIIDGIIIDNADARDARAIEKMGSRVCVTNIVMTTLEDRIRLAHEVLDVALDGRIATGT